MIGQDELLALGILVLVIWLLLDAPIFKPWFGLRRPRNHEGRWFE